MQAASQVPKVASILIPSLVAIMSATDPTFKTRPGKNAAADMEEDLEIIKGQID